jgi:eukaryotic-like serine/threonine-protein kinase
MRLESTDVTCTVCGFEVPEGAPQCEACGAAVGAHPRTSLSHRNLKPVVFREEQPVLAVRVNDVLSARYRLDEKIGEGGMGAVFIAHDLELDRKVAVKLLAASLVNDPQVLERFEREARLTAKLDHPNIVPIYDVGRHQGRPFLVMKLLQGDCLAGLLRKRGGLTVKETLELMRQLARGLDFIHAQGFIHRDVKAANIFVSPEGHATVLDFGILRSKDTQGGLTKTGMVMGTPHYMAPEQALGLKEVDHRVDLYALAVVLFECLTGTLPFEADSELRLIQLQAHAPPPELVERAPWIPKPVADVVRRALAKKPEERFGSAAELVAALETAVRSAPGVAAPVAQPGATPAVSPKTSPGLRQRQHALGSSAATSPRARPLTWVTVAGLVAVAGVAGWRFSVAAHVAIEPVTPFDAGVDEVVELALDGDDDAGSEALALSFDAGAGVKHVGIAAPKRKGKLSVITTHAGEPYWAQVSLDGVQRGRTPLQLDLAPGRYQLLVERPGFRSHGREVKVPSGKAVVVKLELAP